MWKDWNLGFGRQLFEEIDKEFSEAEEMMDRLFRTIRERDHGEINGTFPYYYGYQITVGPDGKPHMREFGNVRPSARGLVEQSGVREPLVDKALDEKENTLTITAEIPGVTKQDIKVNIAEDHVSIRAEKGEKKYHTDVPVDVALDDAPAKATYANGILELRLKLKEHPKPKAREVKIE